MKVVLAGIVALVTIVAIALTIFVGKFDGLIADAIEKYGSEAIGTSVQVGEVNTDLKAGSVDISGINVANPTKYAEPFALQVGGFITKVDYDKKEIAEIIISNPTINAEFIGVENNFDDIVKGLPADETPKTDESADELVLTIQTLKLLAANVNLRSDKLGTQKFVMDDFVMRDIKGTSAQIAKLVVDRLTNHIATQTNDFVKQQTKKEIKKRVVNKAKEVLSEKLGNLKLKRK